MDGSVKMSKKTFQRKGWKTSLHVVMVPEESQIQLGPWTDVQVYLRVHSSQVRTGNGEIDCSLRDAPVIKISRVKRLHVFTDYEDPKCEVTLREAVPPLAPPPL